MGSPLTPILANLFLGFHEETWLNNFNHLHHPLLYRRYVDDTFCVFHNEQDAMSFFDYINSRHPNIKFTFEKENDGKLSFLDILVHNSSRDCVVSVFHKKTYTGLLTNFFSFTPPCYKIGQFSCAGCNSRYIGETSRHFSTRIKEHTESDKNSHIFKHFNTSPLCKNKYSPSCFSILDSASNSIDLKLKEAFYINKIKPELKKQLQHYNTFLTV